MRRITIVLLAAILLLTACSQSDQGQDQAPNQEIREEVKVEEKSETEIKSQDQETEEVKEEVSEEAGQAQETESETESQDTESVKTEVVQPSDEGQLRQEAIQAAAADLGAEPSDLKVFLAEVDLGERQVDLDFYYDGSLYDYEVVNGAVVDKDIDGPLAADLAEELIVADEAIQLALAEFAAMGIDLQLEYLVDYGIELEVENNLYLYEIEFDTGEGEYEIAIDARTGKAISNED